MPVETFTGAAGPDRYGFHSPLVRGARARLLMLPGSAIQALLAIVTCGPLEWNSAGHGILLDAGLGRRRRRSSAHGWSAGSILMR